MILGNLSNVVDSEIVSGEAAKLTIQAAIREAERFIGKMESYDQDQKARMKQQIQVRLLRANALADKFELREFKDEIESCLETIRA